MSYMDYVYFKTYFDVQGRQQNIKDINISKIDRSDFLVDSQDITLELKISHREEIIIYINCGAMMKFSFDSFIQSDYFDIICYYLDLCYEDIIRIGKDYYENYTQSLKPSIHSQYFITYTLKGPFGDELEVSIDYLRNRFYLKTSSESIHDTPLSDIIFLDRFDYEDMKRQVEDYKRLVNVLSSQSIIRLENGYVIDNRYYESLDRVLEERKDDE